MIRFRGSWIWKKLLKYRTVAQDFHRMEIGNGKQTYFWFDNWCSLGRLWSITGSRGTIDVGIPKHCLMCEIPQTRRGRNHRRQVLNQIEDELQNFDQTNVNQDKSLWRTSTGNFRTCFSTKDTWEQLRMVNPRTNWWKGVWFKHNTPKYAFIVWVAIRNRLSTGERMMKWKGNLNGDCILCHMETESVNHLFFQCEFASRIWHDLMQRLMGNMYSNRWTSLLEVITSGLVDKATTFLVRYGFQATIYIIWRERNRRRHGEKPIPKESLVSVIGSNVKNRIRSVRNGELSLETAMEIWLRAQSRD